jgi:hypothetical protein
VVADAGYGNSDELRDGLAERGLRADGVLAHLRARAPRTVPVVLLTTGIAATPEGGAAVETPVEMDTLVRAVLARRAGCRDRPRGVNGRRGKEAPRALPVPPTSEPTPHTTRTTRMTRPHS